MAIVEPGTRIRRARESRGLTQAELATLVGVSATTVRNWETGNFSPRNKTGRIEEVLGISLSENDDPTDRDDITLRKASEAQLLAEVSKRLADLAAEVAGLRQQLAATGIGDPNVLPGPWAARPRRPAPPPEPDSDPDPDAH